MTKWSFREVWVSRALTQFRKEKKEGKVTFDTVSICDVNEWSVVNLVNAMTIEGTVSSFREILKRGDLGTVQFWGVADVKFEEEDDDDGGYVTR